MNILLVDFPTVSGRAWHHMKSPGYVSSSNSEEVEWIRNLGSAGLFIRERFKDYYIVVCADSKSWRHSTWKEYYLKESLAKSFMFGTDLIAYKDGYFFKMFKNGDTPWSKPSKQTKEDMIQMPVGRRTPVLADDCKFQIEEFLGGYKGSRKESQWNFTTPHEEYRKWRANIAPKWASLVGGQYASIAGAEADDIIASAAIRLQKDGHKIVIMSTDQDITWSEKKGYGQLHDFAWSTPSWDTPLRKPIDTDTVVTNIVTKILVGDPGDDIGPVLTKDGARITAERGPLSAKNLVTMGNDLLDYVDPLTWERNFKLIWLRDPGPVEDFIREELDNPRPDTNTPITHWELSDEIIMTEEMRGRAWFTTDQNPETWL